VLGVCVLCWAYTFCVWLSAFCVGIWVCQLLGSGCVLGLLASSFVLLQLFLELDSCARTGPADDRVALCGWEQEEKNKNNMTAMCCRPLLHVVIWTCPE